MKHKRHNVCTYLPTVDLISNGSHKMSKTPYTAENQKSQSSIVRYADKIQATLMTRKKCLIIINILQQYFALYRYHNTSNNTSHTSTTLGNIQVIYAYLYNNILYIYMIQVHSEKVKQVFSNYTYRMLKHSFTILERFVIKHLLCGKKNKLILSIDTEVDKKYIDYKLQFQIF